MYSDMSLKMDSLPADRVASPVVNVRRSSNSVPPVKTMQDASANPEISELIRCSRAGDKVAQSRLVEKYRPYLSLVAKRYVGLKLRRRFDAADIVQQTLAEAWRDMGAFRGTSEPEFSGWICKILHRNIGNVVRDQRAAKRDMNREIEPKINESASVVWFEAPGREVTASQHVVLGERALRLADVLENLPETQRRAVRMRHLEGLPLAEIAERLGKSHAATAGLIKRGLQSLREEMSESMWL